MKGLMGAIAAVMGAFRTVYEYCAKTGRLVSKVIRTPLFGTGGANATMADDEPPAAIQAVEVEERDALADIRTLAGAMAADRVTAEDLEPVADNPITWLQAMDRGMLAKVMCADDASLRAHIRGERSIRGVLAADADSVAAYQRRMSVTMTDDFDDVPAPVMAYAA